MGYKYFDHTADIGIRVYANDYLSLINDSIDAVLNYIYPDYNLSNNSKFINYILFKNILIKANSLEFLIIKIINEILYIMDVENAIVTDFHINYLFIEENKYNFSGVLTLNKIYKKKYANEVKAATLANLKLIKNDKGFKFEFIIDV